MRNDPGFNLYLITDRKQVRNGTLLDAVEKALMGGIKAIQLREKDLSSSELYGLALELRAITARFNARLLINDRIDIAIAVDADGVHLPENGIPADQVRKILPSSRLIGVSCHNLSGAVAAQKNGADFITFGPLFMTPSKAVYGDPVGLAKLAEAASALSIPVFGLGGIKRDHIASVLAAGARGIAMISEIIAAENPMAAGAEIIKILQASKKE